jgi:hypothetical protein
LILLGFLVVVAAPATAVAHGVNAHMWVTDRAIELLPDGDLKAMLTDPANREAVQIGSLFPDTGYAVSAPYGEPAHWEPFVTAAVGYLREKGYLPADTADKKKIVSFFMGAFNHGMQDEIFDSLFLRWSEEQDQKGQDTLDMVCDALLIADGHTKLRPPIYYPAAEAIDVLKRIGVTATEGEFKAGMEKTVNFAVIALQNIAVETADGYRADIPWTVKHYVDPNTSGSFGHEIRVIAEYMEFIWKRLNNSVGTQDVFISAFPYKGEALLGTKAGKVESWASLFTGVAMDDRDITKDRIKLAYGGAPLEADVARTRWSSGDDESRLFIVKPKADLLPCSEYSIEVGSGMRLFDGRKLDAGYSAKILTYCAPDGGPDSGPDAGEDSGDDAGPVPDSGTPDGGAPGGDAKKEPGGCACSAVSIL